jgi:hypothetical protein
MQTGNPGGHSYLHTELSPIEYSAKHCGLIPLSAKHYWIYQDSIFENGIFTHTELDTLKFFKTWQTQPDGLIWWQADKAVGLPDVCYANDSTIFGLEQRVFASPAVFDAKKQIWLSSQDSTRFLTSFIDEAAIGTEKMNKEISSPVGKFSDCIFLEKYAPGYRKEQTYLKPGIGVIKFIHMETPIGSSSMEMQRISTLIKFYID